MIYCPDCNKEISETAECCIHCGCSKERIEELNKIGFQELKSNEKVNEFLILTVCIINLFSSKTLENIIFSIGFYLVAIQALRSFNKIRFMMKCNKQTKGELK